MRILNRKQFLKQPSGIVYSEYRSSGIVTGLYEKGKSFENDWIYVDLLGEIDAHDEVEFHQAFEDAENGKEFRLDYETGCRDGLFREDDMFVVYDKHDVEKLVYKLSTLIAE